MCPAQKEEWQETGTASYVTEPPRKEEKPYMEMGVTAPMVPVDQLLGHSVRCCDTGPCNPVPPARYHPLSRLLIEGAENTINQKPGLRETSGELPRGRRSRTR